MLWGMEDREIIERIGELADEERRLEESHVGEGLSAEDRQRLTDVEVTLDRLWDLLRQRRALRRSGRDPEDAAERQGDVVERYQQ